MKIRTISVKNNVSKKKNLMDKSCVLVHDKEQVNIRVCFYNFLSHDLFVERSNTITQSDFNCNNI